MERVVVLVVQGTEQDPNNRTCSRIGSSGL